MTRSMAMLPEAATVRTCSMAARGPTGFYGDDGDATGGGNDTLYGGTGDDLAYGDDGDDTLYGGAGDDSLFGEGGGDLLYGESGNDTLLGGDQDDRLYGGGGNDTLYGGLGDDSLFGGTGSETIYWTIGDGDDLIDGGTDGGDPLNDTATDVLILQSDPGGHSFDITRVGGGPTVQVVVDSAETLFVDNIEDITIVGGAGNDTVNVGDLTNTPTNVSTITFLAGPATTPWTLQGSPRPQPVGVFADGDAGNDTLISGAGNDLLYGGSGVRHRRWRRRRRHALRRFGV